MENSYAFAEKSAKEEILEPLNDKQREVVVNYHGMNVVVAGPGSGKTRVVVSRAAYMVEDGIPANKMLLFTFSRKGADEMRSRIEAKLGERARGMTVSTYHSFCCRLLRKYADLLGTWNRDFTIYDTEDEENVLKEVMASYQQNSSELEGVKPSALMSYISACKDEMYSPAMAMQHADNDFERAYASIYDLYAKKLREANAFDFDDLIYMMIRIFERHPEVQEEVNKKYVYITADEGQDSSTRDLILINYLVGENRELAWVMDDEQAIYSFRGANIAGVYDFIERNHMKQYRLEQNYRSTGKIVAAARSLVTHNKKRLDKNVFTENPAGDDILYYCCEDQQSEASKVYHTIKACLRAGYHYKDIAILYRMSYLSRPLEQVFLDEGIPYEILNGSPFYARKEVKDILSFLRFILNPNDAEAFKRIINIPKRGIGERSIQKILDKHESLSEKLNQKTDCQNRPIDAIIGTEQDDSFSLLTSCKSVKLRGKAQKGLENFLAEIEQIKESWAAGKGNSCEQENNDKLTIGNLIHLVIDVTGYFKYLKDDDEDSAEDRISNVLELENIAYEYVSLNDFLSNMVIENTDAEDNSDRVKMLTMHASKGMEFPVVIIVGANEGTSPHFRSVQEGLLEEERRLFYVAMTRAEQELVITRAKYVMRQGNPWFCKESRFISEIDKEYLRRL